MISLKCLIDVLQQVQFKLANAIGIHHLNICVRLAIRKLEKYLDKTNRLIVWLATLILHL